MKENARFRGQKILGLCNLLLGLGVALFVLRQIQKMSLEAFLYKRALDLMVVLIPLFIVSIIQFIGGIVFLTSGLNKASVDEVKRAKPAIPEKPKPKPKPKPRPRPPEKPIPKVPEVPEKPAPQAIVVQPHQEIKQKEPSVEQLKQKLKEEEKLRQQTQEKLKEEESALEELRRLLGLPPEEKEKVE